MIILPESGPPDIADIKINSIADLGQLFTTFRPRRIRLNQRELALLARARDLMEGIRKHLDEDDQYRVDLGLGTAVIDEIIEDSGIIELSKGGNIMNEHELTAIKHILDNKVYPERDYYVYRLDTNGKPEGPPIGMKTFYDGVKAATHHHLNHRLVGKNIHYIVIYNREGCLPSFSTEWLPARQTERPQGSRRFQ